MTLSPCNHVAERIALGEPLGELAEHAAACPACQRLVAMSSQLSGTHHDVDPGLGFSARMTVGAQHRLAVRRRHRLAAGLAATVASGAFGVFFLTRSPEIAQHTPDPVAVRQPTEPDLTDDNRPPTAVGNDDLAALVQLADVDRSNRMSARWAHIKQPLAAYKKLLKGVAP